MNPEKSLSRKPGRGLTTLVIALLCLIWGSTWLVIRTGLNDLPPLGSVGVRFTIAALVCSAVAGVWVSYRLKYLNQLLPVGPGPAALVRVKRGMGPQAIAELLAEALGGRNAPLP